MVVVAVPLVLGSAAAAECHGKLQQPEHLCALPTIALGCSSQDFQQRCPKIVPATQEAFELHGFQMSYALQPGDASALQAPAFIVPLE